jgi:RNA polymerase sigma-70 factor (ECF subfamily)
MHVVSAPVLEAWGCLSDEQIVEKVVVGQTALFEVLMRRHNERVYRAARAIVRDESEAEDIMQQAYVNAYSHLRQFDGRSQFSTWLIRIAIHERSHAPVDAAGTSTWIQNRPLASPW